MMTKRTYRYWLKQLLLLLIVIKSNTFLAQTYPVQTNIVTTGPYYNYLSYYTDENQHLQLIVTLTDFNSAPIQARLRFRIEGPGYSLKTKSNVVIGNSFTLNPGVPEFINGIDLAPYFYQGNLDKSPAALNLNKLPEGLTTICVDVIRDGASQEVISTNNCSSFFLQRFQPSQAILPNCASNVDPEQQFFTFQWTSPIGYVPTINTEINYTFSLYEWNDPNNYNIFQTGQGLVYTSQVQQPLLQLSLFDVTLQEGKQYVWRIQSQITSNGFPVDMIENNGLSEICTFTYGKSQTLEESLADGLTINLNSNGEGERKGKAYWTVIDNTPGEGLSTFSNFIVKYRKKPSGNEGFELTWLEDTVQSVNHFIYQLEPSTTYEVRVAGVVGEYVSEFSNTSEFTTQNPRNYACGDTDLPFRPANYTPLAEATPGMVLQIGQFNMTLTEVQQTGGQGHFRGKGLVPVAFLGGAKAKVTFDDILVDNKYIVREGIVQVMTQGVEQWLHDQYQQFIDPIYVDGTISSGYVDTVNNVAWAVVDGVEQSWTFDPPDYPIIVNDESGNQYIFYPDGTVVISTYLEFEDEWQLGAEDVVVFSQAANETFGFDAKEHMQWHEQYSVIRLEKDSTAYFVPNKSMGKDLSDVVSFQAPAGITPIFKLENGTVLSGVNGNNLTIPAFSSKGQKVIYAYNGQNVQIGKLNVFVYDEKEIEVVIVPVANATPDISAIQTQLQQTLGEANLTFNLTLASQWNNATYTTSKHIELPTDVGLLNKYSEDMKGLRDAYFSDPSVEKVNNAYYVFVVPDFSDVSTGSTQSTSVDGYMVRGKALGFVVNGASPTTYAHELGHGIGALDHSWKNNGPAEDSSTNLMDYNGGDNLTKNQWKELRDFDLAPSMWDEAEDAAYSISELDYICIPGQVVFYNTDVYKNLDNKTIQLGSGYMPYAFVGGGTPAQSGCISIIIDSIGNLYWPTSASNSSGYYRLNFEGHIDQTKKYDPPAIGNSNNLVTLSTLVENSNHYVFTRNGAVVLSQIDQSIRCIKSPDDETGSGTGVTIDLNDIVYKEEIPNDYLLSSIPSSPITGANYGGLLTRNGFAIDFSSISSIFMGKELYEFDQNGNHFVSLYAIKGGKKIFAGYIDELEFDSLKISLNQVKFMNVQNLILDNYDMTEAASGARIMYRLYEPRLDNCYEEFSFEHSGQDEYIWEEGYRKYDGEIDHRIEWRGCGLELLKQIYCESVISGFEDLGSFVSGLLDEVEINEKYYNPEHSEYDPVLYEIFSSISPSDWALQNQAQQLQFAYVCGLANGVLEEAEGITSALGVLARYLCDEVYQQEINTAISNVTFSQIEDKIVESFQGNNYQKAHMSGKYTVMILTVVIPITKVNWAAKIATFSTKITQFSKVTVRFLDKVKSGALAGWRTVNTGTKKLLFKKSTNVEEIILKLSDEGVYIVETEFFGTVDNTYQLVHEIGEVNFKIGDNGSEQFGQLAIYKKGDDVRVVSGAGSSLSFINGWTKQSIIAKVSELKAVGQKLNPSQYLSLTYITNHLNKFKTKASYLVTGDTYDNFILGKPTVGRPDGLFISTVDDIDDVIVKANGNISIIEQELGIPAGSWQGKGGIVRIDINNPENFNLRIPDGSEAGANSLWEPGGLTSGGKAEAVTNPIPTANINANKIIQ